MRAFKRNSIAALLTAVILAAAIPASVPASVTSGAESLNSNGALAGVGRLEIGNEGTHPGIDGSLITGSTTFAGDQAVADGSSNKVVPVAFGDDWHYINGRPYRCDKYGHYYPVYRDARPYGYNDHYRDYDRHDYDRHYYERRDRRDFHDHDGYRDRDGHWHHY